MRQMPLENWTNEAICPSCGKQFFMLYPHLWAYKDGRDKYCSWKCLRANEEKKKMLRKAIMPKDKALDAILKGIEAGRHPYGCSRRPGITI